MGNFIPLFCSRKKQATVHKSPFRLDISENKKSIKADARGKEKKKVSSTHGGKVGSSFGCYCMASIPMPSDLALPQDLTRVGSVVRTMECVGE